jgi:hypothetical protein
VTEDRETPSALMESTGAVPDEHLSLAAAI